MVHGKTVEKRGVPRDVYLELIQVFPLRPIRNRAELDQAVRVVDSLLDKESLLPSEADYLEVLGDLISKYEAENESFDSPSDGAMLAHLLEARGLTQAELARQTRIASSTLSAVLSEKRRLTRAHIDKLAHFFNVAPAAFYEGKR